MNEDSFGGLDRALVALCNQFAVLSITALGPEGYEAVQETRRRCLLVLKELRESPLPASAIDPLAEALFASLIAKGMPHPGNSAFRPTVREAARASLEAAKAFREEQAK